VPDHGRYPADDGPTRAQDRTATLGGGVPTMLESNHPAAPPLRLITGGKVAETTVSGARAGRGRSVELGLPEVPTVSREHAKFTYQGGQWYVTNLGMNGITVNGHPVTGEEPVHSGDSIRWGTRPDALQSEVEIG
jgi:pSer/pThr/pTyr-binding forkhead associated (FHA) protein